MTTVAYAAGVMAADTQATVGDSHTFQIRKIFEVEGHLIGFAGDAILGNQFREWYARRLSGDLVEPFTVDEPDPRMLEYRLGLEVMVVTPEGQIQVYDGRHTPLYPMGDYHAIGSGAVGALVAMSLGKGAVEAVESAVRFDPYSGGPVISLKLGGRSHEARP